MSTLRGLNLRFIVVVLAVLGVAGCASQGGGAGAGLRLLSLTGIGVMVGLAWLLSVDRSSIRWRPVFWGIALQLAFGLVVLHPALQGFFFEIVDSGVRKLL
ncbi:MAG: Na+ dependent nucleoside transporter N-terminal domain-containing protein, partial [Myxococcota bacterium]|nr:Na+ dependent nucleoside transporter N-terminal domain-containing protein [Myxococcota bacterium]